VSVDPEVSWHFMRPDLEHFTHAAIAALFLELEVEMEPEITTSGQRPTLFGREDLIQRRETSKQFLVISAFEG
jgi:hypothetical protein